ncbi:MAG TPA: carbon-nitrogen hydrolase family protein [Firmicutes bacterium]|nr:carbon-nitrogen hydrolase family protein [Bacillota bacterium]
MSRRITISAIQLPDYHGEGTLEEKRDYNVRVAFEMIEEAAGRGSDIVCLPEVFQVVGVAETSDEFVRFAEPEEGGLAKALCGLARRLGVSMIAPVVGLYGETLRNVAWVISKEGKIVGRYFKVHCTRGERDRGILPGDSWPVFDLGFAKLGVMICHDNSFPESARCLALNGAEIIFWPHVQSGWGDEVWDITLRSRAIDNAVYIVSCCFGRRPGEGWRPGMMVGRSGVIGPDGMILVEAGRTQGIATTTVDLDLPVIKHSFTKAGWQDFKVEMLRDRRPETYGVIAKTSR